MKRTKQALTVIGYNLSDYPAGISFRRGLAQSGVYAGLRDDEIRLLGDWAPGSKWFTVYRKRTLVELADMRSKLARRALALGIEQRL